MKRAKKVAKAPDKGRKGCSGSGKLNRHIQLPRPFPISNPASRHMNFGSARSN